MMQPTILIVGDEPAILKAITRIFHRSKLQIRAAVTSIDALRILDKTPASVVVSNYSMPQQTEAELMAQARNICPNTVRILSSGNNDQTTTIFAIDQSRVFKCVAKPFYEISLIHDFVAAAPECHTSKLIYLAKKLLKQVALFQLVNSEQVQSTAIEAIAVVLDA